MTQPPNGKRVLIVDDADAVRSVLRLLLQQAGFTIAGEFSSGASLLHTAQQMKPDIICLDFGLPGVDGLQLLRDLRAVCPDTAVVMITASHDLQLEQEAAQAGVAGFIRKPFSPARIHEELRQVAHALDLLRQTRQQAPDAVAPGRGVKVLVADDSQVMRSVLAEILRKAGLQVVGEACDGKQALEMAAAHQPDIICLDLSMPLMSGMEVLQVLRRQNPGAQVMIVTATSSREFIHEAAALGAKGYILKPYQSDKVIEVLQRLLARRQ